MAEKLTKDTRDRLTKIHRAKSYAIRGLTYAAPSAAVTRYMVGDKPRLTAVGATAGALLGVADKRLEEIVMKDPKLRKQLAPEPSSPTAKLLNKLSAAYPDLEKAAEAQLSASYDKVAASADEASSFLHMTLTR